MEYFGSVLKLCLIGSGCIFPPQGGIILPLASFMETCFPLGPWRVTFSVFTESPELKSHLISSFQRFLFFSPAPSYDQDSEGKAEQMENTKERETTASVVQ